ncbi:MAG: glutamate 5-kinase [Actinomycetota bacterium]
MNRVVVKIGTSSITDDDGAVDRATIAKLCDEVAGLRANGVDVVIVTSAAIAAGLPELGLGGARRPTDAITLQAVATVGQSALMEVYRAELARHALIAGQVLLVPQDFITRSQYLHARQTLNRLLELGVVPVVNENDAIADDEIRWGDNDRIAALVANLVDAHRLVLLTDTEGLLTADPRLDDEASLIEEIQQIDQQHEALAGGAGTVRGSGGMASKLAAAKIASWSGVDTVIARASRADVVAQAVTEPATVGTTVRARPTKLPARKCWIAFAVVARGTIVVDTGARRALESGKSLLAAGVRSVEGRFDPGAPVDVTDTDGVVFAKGLARHGSDEVARAAGHRSGDLPPGAPAVVIHADDLVTIPG